MRGLKNVNFYATKGKKIRKKYDKTLDKMIKKWYHIYIIGDNYARLRVGVHMLPYKKDFSNRPNVEVWRKFRQSEVFCYEKVQQSSRNAVSTRNCSGCSAYQCAC